MMDNVFFLHVNDYRGCLPHRAVKAMKMRRTVRTCVVVVVEQFIVLLVQLLSSCHDECSAAAVVSGR